MRAVLLVLCCLAIAAPAVAQDVTISPNDTTQSVLAAREFFDAVVPLEAVEAVFIRAK